jgi:DNA modification methylase
MDLYNGDCLQILKDISSNSVDLVICDLPFGCLSAPRACKGPGWRKVEAETGKKAEVIRQEKDVCAWDVPIDLEAFWKEIRRIRRNDHTPCLHFCTTKYGFDLWESNKKEFRYDLVWDKGRGVSFLSANKMPMRSHEMIYVFSKAGSYYNRIDISGDFKKWETSKGVIQSGYTFGNKKERAVEGGDGKRCALSVIPNPASSGTGRHPTEKPIELYKFLIERYCPAGGTVLDPTFGSGNSGLAARELQRKYIGIEKDKTFFDKAKKKLLPDQ